MFSLKVLAKNLMHPCIAAAITYVTLLPWLSMQPFGVIFVLIFSYWSYKTRCPFRIVVPPELLKHCQLTLDKLQNWKRAKPAVFCATTSGCLAILAVIGHFLSGSMVVLIGLVIAVIISTKYNFKIVDKESQVYASVRPVEAEDEFMPELNETNFIVLEKAAESSSIYEVEGEADDSDEIPSELSLPPDTLPEIDDASSSEDEQNDLLPVPRDGLSRSAADECSITELSDNIELKKDYFKRDSALSTTSTSSSEESLSKGLQFPDHRVVDRKTPSVVVANCNQEINNAVALAQTQTLLTHGSKLLPGFVSGVMEGLLGANNKTASNRNYVEVQNSSGDSDSDFELIETDEFN